MNRIKRFLACLTTALTLGVAICAPLQQASTWFPEVALTAEAADTKVASLVKNNVKYNLFKGSSGRYAVISGGQTALTTLNPPQALTYGSYTYPITQIAEYAFDGHTLTTVDLRNARSLKTIGGMAFQKCNRLTQVYFPSSLKTIDRLAFFLCTSLQRATFAAGSSNLEIGMNVFNYCDSLTNVKLVEGVTAIGDYCFSGSYRLTYCDLPNSLKSLGRGAFESTNLSSSVQIGPNLTEMGIAPFGNTKRIAWYSVHSQNPAFKSVNGVLYTKDGITLLAYPSLLSYPTFSTNARVIAPYAFQYNPYLRELSIPYASTSDFNLNYMGFSSLERVTISASEYQKSTSAILRDYKNLFIGSKVNYINGTPIATNPTTGEPSFSSKFFTYIFTYFNQYESYSFMQAYMENMAAYVIAQTTTPDMTDFQKAVRLHQWVVNRVEYDYNAQALGDEKVHSVCSIFLNENRNGHRYTVCDGYAKGYQFLMQHAGIETYKVSGKHINGGDNHAWNLARINGNLYHIDCCWDDNQQTMEFFMKTDFDFECDEHCWYDWSCDDAPSLRKGNNVATKDATRLGDISGRGSLSNQFQQERIDYLEAYLNGTRQLNATLLYNADLNMDGKVDNTDLTILKAGRGSYANFFEKLVHSYLL